MTNQDLRIALSQGFVACALLASTAHGQLGAPLFAAPIHQVGDDPVDVELGDFNADGKLDWAASANSGNNVTVRFGDGLGGFGTVTTLATASFPNGIVAADFDGDGDDDLAVAVASNSQVRVFFSNGAGGFAAPVAYTIINVALDLSAGDTDGDGDQDLVVACHQSNVIVKMRNTGAGAFNVLASNVAIGTGPRTVQLADVNGDSALDLVVTLDTIDKIAVALGGGGGNYGAAAMFAVGDFPVATAVGDLDGDGNADIAVANNAGSSFTLLHGDGLGSFGTPTTLSGQPFPHSVAIADFNADGKSDLLTSNSGSLKCWIGDGAGALTVRPGLTVGSVVVALALGDVNADGRLDVLGAERDLDRVSVHLGNGLGDFPASQRFALGSDLRVALTRDLDLDGRVDMVLLEGAIATTPVLRLMAGRGAGQFEEQPGSTGLYNSVAADDLDGDGQIDLVTADGAAGNVDVRLGLGAFGYAAPQSYPAIAGCSALALADVSGDGELDALVLSTSPATIGVLPGDGLGAFGPASTFAVPANPSDVTTTDLDGDLDLDVVVICNTSGTVAWLANDGTGQLGPAQTTSMGAALTDFVLADLDEDGFADFLGTVPSTNSVRVMFGDGVGGFVNTFGGVSGSPNQPQRVARGDFNGDGHVDIVAAGINSVVLVYLGDGTGALAAAQRFLLPSYTALMCDDFDGDGRSDLATASFSLVSVLLNRSACAPIAYCTAGTTSSGCLPTLASSGLPSVSATSGFVITLSSTEGQKQGLYFYGLSGRKESVWSPGSSSVLCVKSPVQRTSTQSSGGTSGACDGSYSLDLADYWATHASALGQPLNAGTTIDVQAWFRDPAAPATTNLSGGIEFVTCP